MDLRNEIAGIGRELADHPRLIDAPTSFRVHVARVMLLLFYAQWMRENGGWDDDHAAKTSDEVRA